MIAFLEGKLALRTADAAYVNVGGVGYEVHMSQTALSKLPEVGSFIELLTYLQVRDDAFVLYGFLSQEEKAMFEQLISVSGVGPKVALSVLSFYTPSDLVNAVQAQDVARVSKVPGIGKKTAGRIILELQGSLAQGIPNLNTEEASTSIGENSAEGIAKEVYDALLSMGFTSAEAKLALEGAPENADISGLLQYSLKKLG